MTSTTDASGRGRDNSVRQGSYGRLFVVSGPSGVGKDALLSRVLGTVPGLTRSVSATTRPPRPHEVNDADYHFISRPEFERAIQEGLFFEYAEYADNLYGTLRSTVEEQRARGQDVVLKIEVQGAKNVRKLAPDAILIFVQPPSMEELERRLRTRDTDSEERIQERLATARVEMESIPLYDYRVVNDILEVAADALRAIVIAERHRIHSGGKECPSLPC